MSRRDRVVPSEGNGYWLPFDLPALQMNIRKYLRGESDSEPEGFALLVLHHGCQDAKNPPCYRLSGMQHALDRGFPIACTTCGDSFVPHHPTYINCPGCRAKRRVALAALQRVVS